MKPSHPSILLLLLGISGSLVNAAPPRLEIEPGVELTWSTTTGNTYQAQWAPAASGPWTNIGLAVRGDGSNWNLYDPGATGSRHYRLVETVPGSDPVPSIPFNSGFESGSGGDPDNWTTAANQPPARTSMDARSGTFSIQATLENVGNNASEGLLSQDVGSQGGSVINGASYDFSFWAKQVSSGPSYVQQYELQWLNGAGGVVGGTGLKTFSAPVGMWTRIAPDPLMAPSNAVNAKIRFRFVTGAVTDGHGETLIDDVSLTSDSDVGTPPETNYLPLPAQAVSKLSWETSLGVPYQPASTTDFIGWTNIDPVVQGDGSVHDLLIPITKNAEFYRIGYPSDPDIPDPENGLAPLFNAGTALEPELAVDTPSALITHIADRARDRHAREGNFNAYDHYLSWYWEQRVANVEIVDRVAKGGTGITFNYTTLDRLSASEFRTFFRGINTVAEYNGNQMATLVSVTPSATPGETDYNYSATITDNPNEGGRAIRIGDRIEIEISQFLASPRNGRNNYYGTTMLYIVGEGIVPWAQGNDLGFPGGTPANVNRDLDSHPLPIEAWLGGQTTLPYQYSNEPEHRFKQTAGNISPTNGQLFMLGRRLHHTDFGSGAHSEPGNPVFSDQVGKLGPDFISRSCVECHTNNGRALPPEIGQPMFKTVMRVASDAQGSPHPILGSVLQPRSTNGGAEASATIANYVTSSGQYGDGTPYSLRKPVYSFGGVTPSFFSARLAPPLVGMGLLEAVSETTIIAMADPEDSNGDGISGRYQTAPDPETGEIRLGRFTGKASQARLSHQVAAALNTDMGVTTPVFPTLDGETIAQTPEVDANELDLITRYVALLGVGARRDLDDAQALRGEQLFTSAQCILCHAPELRTGPYHPMAELRDQTIRPYTDLLLHDMGPGLADNMAEGGVSGSEWRTPPLWNIGLTAGVSGGEAYLHDGRARTLEEAILWHGGEAETSKEAFRTMPSADRDALIRFLKSL